MSLSKLNLLYSVYQKLLLRKIKDDSINCGKSALHMWCWSTILNSWFSGTFFPSFENQWHVLRTGLTWTAPNAPVQQAICFILSFIYLFLRRVWLFSLGSPAKNQLFLLHITTHRGKHAYRFAVFVFLQRAHHWAAFLLESDLSASAHFHSLLCRRKNIAKSLVFIFFSPKNYRKHSSYTLCYTCPAIICLSPISLPGKRESAVGAVPALMQFPLTTFGISPFYM